MKKKNMRVKNIVGIFAILLMASIFVMPVSAQNSGIPIKLELTAEPSTIEVGETAIITVRLLDENDKPVVTEVDISVSISTNLGSVPSSIVIPAGADLSKTKFTSKVSGIAVISAKSKGLIGDTTSIAVTMEERFRVEPMVVLRPVVDIIEKGQDGVVELYMDNPTLNDVVLHVEAHITVPAGIHVYSEQYAWATAAGVAYGLFEVPPGAAETISIHIKADETARIGQYTLHFSGLYYPGNNKDIYNPISLAYPVTVKEASMKAPTPTPGGTPEPIMSGFEAVFAIAGLLIIAYLLRRRG